MDAEVGVVDDACEREKVECLHHHIVDLLRVLNTAFRSKIILGSHDARLMVSSQEEDAFGVLNFKAHKEHHHFNRIYSTIDIVSKKHQFCVQLPLPA